MTTERARHRVGACIRQARWPLTQTELGNLLGIPQTTISRWERGEVDLSYSQVYAIERVLGLRPGTIGRRSGFVI